MNLDFPNSCAKVKLIINYELCTPNYFQNNLATS